MFVRTVAAVTAVVMCGIGGCEPTTSTTSTNGTNVLDRCTTDVVTVNYGEPTACDVVPPQRIDVVYPLDMSYDAVALDCGTSGGSLVLVLPRICRDVDY